jgi:hypothetical protein
MKKPTKSKGHHKTGQSKQEAKGDQQAGSWLKEKNN